MNPYLSLTLYCVLLTICFYIQSYGSATKKFGIYLLGAIGLLVVMIWHIQYGSLPDSSTFNIILLLAYTIVITAPRIYFEQWLKQRTLQKVFPTKYVPKIDEMKHKLALFENAIKVKKFNLSEYIADTDIYKNGNQYINEIIEKTDYITNNLARFQYDDIMKHIQLIVDLTDATNCMLNEFPLENDKTVIDAFIESYYESAKGHALYLDLIIQKSNKKQERKQSWRIQKTQKPKQ